MSRTKTVLKLEHFLIAQLTFTVEIKVISPISVLKQFDG